VEATEVLPDLAVSGGKFERLAQGRFRFGVPRLHRPGHAQVQVGFGVAGVQAGGQEKLRTRLVQQSGAQEEVPRGALDARVFAFQDGGAVQRDLHLR